MFTHNDACCVLLDSNVLFWVVLFVVDKKMYYLCANKIQFL